MEAFNRLYSDWVEPADDYREIIVNLTDTSSLEKKAAKFAFAFRP